MHDMPTPVEWGLNTLERVDVNQADIAPLMVHIVDLSYGSLFPALLRFLQPCLDCWIWNANI